MTTITLYDIPSNTPNQPWSRNTLKARISLNYKRLAYKTEWLEYPDIEPTLKRLGAAPTGKKPDGSPRYTLPVIHDPATGRYISDSFAIAEYLDATYPATPPLFPAGTRGAIALFEHTLVQHVFAPFYPAMQVAQIAILNPRSAAYLRAAREARFGRALEELVPPGPARDARWAQAKAGMALLAGFYDKNGRDQLFFFGDVFSYADVVLVAILICSKVILGSEDAVTIASWNDGRWAKIDEATKEYQATTIA